MELALIVDDSKTARVMLQKMLDKLGIPTASVESGEEALEYLKTQHPDIIFMDHMMPGMDGFAAVKAIKSDPLKASIPIVMHTTKQGDIYVGQARALGAADILPKPANDEELKEVLASVQKQVRARALARTTTEMAVVVVEDDFDENEASEEPAAAIEEEEVIAVSEGTFLGSPRQWFFAVVWLIPVVWLLVLYLSGQQQIQIYKDAERGYLKNLAWAINRQSSYDFDEVPLSGDRLALLQFIVPSLERVGFEGIIRLEGHIGEFCLSEISLQNGDDVLMLPGPELPLASCDLIGSSVSQAMARSTQQSGEFTDYVKQVNARPNGISIEIQPFGASRPLYDYPIELDGINSGDWNSIALSNNRIRFQFISKM